MTSAAAARERSHGGSPPRADSLLLQVSLPPGVGFVRQGVSLALALLIVVGDDAAELAQLLAGCEALLLQALVVLSQVGHLCQQNDFILLLLVVERRHEERRRETTCHPTTSGTAILAVGGIICAIARLKVT